MRARRDRWQKQLTLVELTLDTFLMRTCGGGCSAGSLEAGLEPTGGCPVAPAPKAAALWPAVRLPVGQLHKPIAKSYVGVQFQKRDQASPLFGPALGNTPRV